MKLKSLHEEYIRSALFGLQDGLVSTTGVVVGISIGVPDKSIIILAAIVAVLVEASSMAAGQYTSQKTAHEMDKSGNKRDDNVYIGSAIMFFGYFFGGLVPILPTIIFNQPEARFYAIVAAFVGLFTVGYIRGKIIEGKPLRSAIELFIIGGIATVVGVAAGYFLRVH